MFLLLTITLLVLFLLLLYVTCIMCIYTTGLRTLCSVATIDQSQKQTLYQAGWSRKQSEKDKLLLFAYLVLLITRTPSSSMTWNIMSRYATPPLAQLKCNQSPIIVWIATVGLTRTRFLCNQWTAKSLWRKFSGSIERMWPLLSPSLQRQQQPSFRKTKSCRRWRVQPGKEKMKEEKRTTYFFTNACLYRDIYYF